MSDNEKAKIEAVKLQNYSFHAGSPIEYSESYSKTSTETSNFSLLVGGALTNETDLKGAGSGIRLQISEEISTQHGGEFATTEEASHSKGFVLSEDGNDYISVDVCHEATEGESEGKKEEAYSTFIFKTKAGATSCPYEGEYKTKYYEPGTQIDASTIQIEKPVIDVKEGQNFIKNIPSGKPAYITLYLKNASELNEDGWYNLKIIDGSNPNGAKLYMDGAAIGNGRALLVPAGQILTKTLEVSKGSIMNYDNLQLALESQCQSDIADTVTFSVHFTPSCTDVNIKKPTNNWTYNTKLKTVEKAGVPNHYMDVILDGFDVNYDNFSRIKLQYKASSDSDEDWITLMSYYKNEADYEAAIAKDKDAAAEIIDATSKGTINYRWMLDDKQDQRYDLRAVGVCVINNEEVENVSPVHSGIKDMYTPRLFGSAQPANGILTVNDEVRLNFNEKIAEGYLTKKKFQVSGIRNDALADHSVSVRLDGSNDRLTSEFTRNWANKDLTIEMWVFSDKPQDATYFSQGNVNESMEFGITADNHLRVKIGSNQIISTDAVTYKQGDWAHVAFVLNAKENKVSAYYNGTEYISGVSINTYAGEGNYLFGANINGGGNFAGKMDNARIWDKVVSLARIKADKYKLLSGAENNLLAYYPMNEAKGSELKDKARGANLSMNGSEWTLPEGRAATFNGTSQYVRLNAGSSTIIDQTMDYTMELWFKGEAGQSNATLVSNGRGDGLDMDGSRTLFSIGFEGGILTYHNNGVKAVVDGNYLDNDWHHLALAVSRTNGRAQLLVDGILKTFFEAQDLGGVSAPYMYLGARGWTSVEHNPTVTIDNFFKGEIDEFRLWNLYKNESIINNSNSEHLDGEEMGLLAYYPFDYCIDFQGTKELNFTLSDKKVQRDSSQLVKDAEVFGGGSVETSASAPIKDKGPVSKIGFDFVVNNDALIINFDNKEWERIEKSIITFTVEEVQDMNGNVLSSPVTWSAYIDHNQLKWNENEISIEKPIDVEKTFVVKAVNHGGSVQRFDMENMPSWLNVEPMRGTINPSSSLDITFTVDAGLNIGSYNEIVYMRNENKTSEALPINVKVKGEKPDWNVNPANYKYNMSVFGKLSINRIYSIDKEDLLAAFYKGACVGVVNNSYSKENDMYYALLTVYSNEAATGDLEFRIWDASTGVIYNAMPTNAISFGNNKVVGSPTAPIVFTAQDLRVQQIPLNSGWNWVSFNVANNTLNDINATLGNNVWSKNDIVKSEIGGFASYSEDGWVGSLTGFDNTSMYMIQSEKSQRIDLTGTSVDTKQTKLSILGSKEDGTTLWNYISYLPSINLKLKEALAGYPAVEGDIVKSQNKFAMYTGNTGWIGSLSNMESGKGYMLQRNAKGNVELQYPSVSINSRLKAKTRANQTEEGYINANYVNNMTMIAQIVGMDVQAGDKLIAYVEGEKRGEASVIRVPGTNNDLFFLTVVGDKAENVSVALESNGKTVASSEKVTTYANNQTKGTLAQPMLIDLSKNAKDANIYPSPFDEVLTIKLNVEKEADVNITITDTQGRLIDNFEGCNKDGNVSIEWKGAAHLTSGIYMVNIMIDQVKSVYKVIKK
ncbi:MAG: LamG-like jellyroll fold domain-containing protein [Bacteroidaceae bacterium]